MPLYCGATLIVLLYEIKEMETSAVDKRNMFMAVVLGQNVEFLSDPCRSIDERTLKYYF